MEKKALTLFVVRLRKYDDPFALHCHTDFKTKTPLRPSLLHTPPNLIPKITRMNALPPRLIWRLDLTHFRNILTIRVRVKRDGRGQLPNSKPQAKVTRTMCDWYAVATT